MRHLAVQSRGQPQRLLQNLWPSSTRTIAYRSCVPSIHTTPSWSAIADSMSISCWSYPRHIHCLGQCSLALCGACAKKFGTTSRLWNTNLDGGVAPHSTATSAAKNHKKDNPIQTLSSFMNVEKLQQHSAREIELLWKARHEGSVDLLCGVIPRETFQRMEKAARQFPMVRINKLLASETDSTMALKYSDLLLLLTTKQFVLPLPRDGQGIEMFFTQWAFPHKDVAHLIMTSLLEYKTRREFAVPQLTVSHHKELQDSNDIVLMRAHIDNLHTLTPEQAQLLIMTMQKFYAPDPESSEGKLRASLLSRFSSNDPHFDIQDVIDEADQLI